MKLWDESLGRMVAFPAQMNPARMNPGRRWTLLGSDGTALFERHPGTLGGHRSRRKSTDGSTAAPRWQAIARGGYVRNACSSPMNSTAVAAGYRPCAVCMPAEYARWKSRR